MAAGATQQLTSFESGHSDMVHAAEFDYYGKRLATCSSDRLIKVFDVVGDQVIVCLYQEHLSDCFQKTS